MFEHHLSQSEGTSSPDEAYFNQTKLIPQHTGIEGQQHRLSSKCRQDMAQYRLIEPLGIDLLIVQEVA